MQIKGENGRPAQVTVGATLDVTGLVIGIDGATPVLAPGLDVKGALHITVSTVSAQIKLSLLKATITSGAIDLHPSVELKFNDGDSDGEIQVGELIGANLTFTPHSDPLNIGLTATLGADLTLGPAGGSTVPLASAKLTITTPGPLLGDPSGPPVPQVSFTSPDAGGVTSLLNSFSSAGPLQILDMLNQVESFLAGLANQQIMSTAIPFTNITIGSALDYARSFKHDVLDPLFKSGDASHPDADNDGSVDFNDLNFDSIQALLDRMGVAIGLAPGTLKANLDPTTNQLTFNFSFNKQLGIGTSVDVLTAPVAAAAPDEPSGGHDQELTIGNVSGGSFKLSYTYNQQPAVGATAASGGSLLPGTYYYRLTATSLALGETIASAET